MKITKKGLGIAVGVCIIGFIALTVPKYILTKVNDYEHSRADQKRALEQAHWIYDSKGRRYETADGKTPMNTWLAIDNSNYHFDEGGYMTIGWLKDKNQRYYLKQNGTIQTGWLQEKNSWYYFNDNGTLATGWIVSEDKHYFLGTDGAMATEWLEDQGHRYYLGTDGAMITGWIDLSGNRYYLKEDGTMAAGWLNTQGHWYYLRDDGAMTIGWVTDQERRYFMNPDGSMASNVWIEDGKSKYFINEDGTPAIGWLSKDKSYYYLHEDGSAAIGWLELESTWYYFYGDGTMATGWITDETGSSYFLKDNGVWDSAAQVIQSQTPEVTVPPKTGPMVALTFDDGPGKYTDHILSVLQNNDAKATFFMLGENIPKYSSTVMRMAQNGCEIANHSYDHSDLSVMDASGIHKEISSTNQALVNILGYGARLVRPPYGSYNMTVRSNSQSPLILWSIDTLDWKTRNAQTTIDTVINTVKDGDIILMHDIHEPTAAAVDHLVPKLKELGYQLVTVSELAAANSIKLANGSSYGSFR